jgi:hypothetical protein
VVELSENSAKRVIMRHTISTESWNHRNRIPKPSSRSATVWIWNFWIELFKKFKHRRARACPPKILTSCHILSHNFEIVHTDTPFRQATMGFSSSLATKPYKNNLVLISIVFIISPYRFWSVLSSFWTLPGRHRVDPSTHEDVSCVELPILHTDCCCVSGTFAP